MIPILDGRSVLEEDQESRDRLGNSSHLLPPDESPASSFTVPKHARPISWGQQLSLRAQIAMIVKRINDNYATTGRPAVYYEETHRAYPLHKRLALWAIADIYLQTPVRFYSVESLPDSVVLSRISPSPTPFVRSGRG